MANTYGYARVSSADQNEARQIVALRSAGIDDERISLAFKQLIERKRCVGTHLARTFRARRLA